MSSLESDEQCISCTSFDQCACVVSYDATPIFKELAMSQLNPEYPLRWFCAEGANRATWDGEDFDVELVWFTAEPDELRRRSTVSVSWYLGSFELQVTAGEKPDEDTLANLLADITAWDRGRRTLYRGEIE